MPSIGVAGSPVPSAVTWPLMVPAGMSVALRTTCWPATSESTLASQSWRWSFHHSASHDGPPWNQSR